MAYIRRLAPLSNPTPLGATDVLWRFWPNISPQIFSKHPLLMVTNIIFTLVHLFIHHNYLCKYSAKQIYKATNVTDASAEIESVYPVVLKHFDVKGYHEQIWVLPHQPMISFIFLALGLMHFRLLYNVSFVHYGTEWATGHHLAAQVSPDAPAGEKWTNCFGRKFSEDAPGGVRWRVRSLWPERTEHEQYLE